MKMLKMLFVSICLILLSNSDLIAQNKAINTLSFEQKTKWLAKIIKQGGNYTFHSRAGTTESKISQIKFNRCEVTIQRTSFHYPLSVTKASDLSSTSAPDFMKDEKYQVDALKQGKSVDTTSFNLADLDPEQIKINWSPDKKSLEDRGKKLVALILPTHNEDKAIESSAGKFPLFSSRTLFFVNLETAEEFNRVFTEVIKECQ